jgi:hypothetical protein
MCDLVCLLEIHFSIVIFCFLIAIIDLIDFCCCCYWLLTYIRFIFDSIKKENDWFIWNEIFGFFLFVGLFPLHLAGAYSAALPTTYGWVHFHFFCSSVLRLDEWTPCREIKSIFKLKKRTNERKKECLFEKQNIRVINRIWWKTTLCVLTHTYGSDDDVMFK